MNRHSHQKTLNDATTTHTGLVRLLQKHNTAIGACFNLHTRPHNGVLIDQLGGNSGKVVEHDARETRDPRKRARRIPHLAPGKDTVDKCALSTQVEKGLVEMVGKHNVLQARGRRNGSRQSAAHLVRHVKRVYRLDTRVAGLKRAAQRIDGGHARPGQVHFSRMRERALQ